MAETVRSLIRPRSRTLQRAIDNRPWSAPAEASARGSTSALRREPPIPKAILLGPLSAPVTITTHSAVCRPQPAAINRSMEQGGYLRVARNIWARLWTRPHKKLAAAHLLLFNRSSNYHPHPTSGVPQEAALQTTNSVGVEQQVRSSDRSRRGDAGNAPRVLGAGDIEYSEGAVTGAQETMKVKRRVCNSRNRSRWVYAGGASG